MLCRLLCLCCALALISTNTHAQSRFPNANGQALAGVSSFNASVLISWLNGDRERDLFLENVQSAFELSLRRDGIRVEGLRLISSSVISTQPILVARLLGLPWSSSSPLSQLACTG